jgi:transposase
MENVLTRVNGDVAGIDVGSRLFFVGANALDGNGEVKSFDTYTDGCRQLLAYLRENGVRKVAMEATGCYWKVLYSMLAGDGIDVTVANGRHVKHVPGRKTDVKDCAWIKELHSYGLLRKSFVPAAEVEELRHYMRIREKDIENKSDAVRRMDKALVGMNIRLGNAISDIQGKSGLAIIKAILDGQRDPAELAKLCDGRIAADKREEVLRSLEGLYDKAHLFSLSHAYGHYCFYASEIQKCDAEIETLLGTMSEGKPGIDPEEKFKRVYHNRPAIKDLDRMVMQIYGGKNLTVLPGMTSYTLLKFLSETGTDLSAWPTAKRFVAWMGLAPSQYQSGSTRKYKKIKYTTAAGQILKEAVQSLLRSKNCALGLWGRQVAARRGPSVAIKGMARKLAIWIYNIMTKGLAFVENGIKQYEDQQREKRLKRLKKEAARLNFALVDLQTAEMA